MVKNILVTMTFTLALLIFSPIASAQQTNSGGNSDVKSACEISGGTWTESGTGNWACCWSDWGCYGCVNGLCKIKCTTQRCKDANRVRVPPKKYQQVKGLAPKGMKAPVAPKPTTKQPANINTMQMR